MTTTTTSPSWADIDALFVAAAGFVPDSDFVRRVSPDSVPGLRSVARATGCTVSEIRRRLIDRPPHRWSDEHLRSFAAHAIDGECGADLAAGVTGMDPAEVRRRIGA